MTRCSVCNQPICYTKKVNDAFSDGASLELCRDCYCEIEQSAYEWTEQHCDNNDDDVENLVELFCEEMSEDELTYYTFNEIYNMYCDYCEEENEEPKKELIFSREVQTVFNLKTVWKYDKDSGKQKKFFEKRKNKND